MGSQVKWYFLTPLPVHCSCISSGVTRCHSHKTWWLSEECFTHFKVHEIMSVHLLDRCLPDRFLAWNWWFVKATYCMDENMWGFWEYKNCWNCVGQLHHGEEDKCFKLVPTVFCEWSLICALPQDSLWDIWKSPRWQKTKGYIRPC